MIRTAALVLTLASACTASRPAYVANVEVRGNLLLVEKCAVVRSGDELQRGACFVEQHLIPSARRARGGGR